MLGRRRGAGASFEAISFSRRAERIPRGTRKAEPTGDLPGKTRSGGHRCKVAFSGCHWRQPLALLQSLPLSVTPPRSATDAEEGLDELCSGPAHSQQPEWVAKGLVATPTLPLKVLGWGGFTYKLEGGVHSAPEPSAQPPTVSKSPHVPGAVIWCQGHRSECSLSMVGHDLP